VDVQAGPVLTVEMTSTDPGDVVIEYVDTPDALPVVVAGSSPADDGRAEDFSFPALAEQPQEFNVVARESSLPRVGRRGLLFDLDYAVRAAERNSALSDNTRLRYEVWADPEAPADLTSRLAASGLQVLGETSISSQLNRLSRAAPALGLRLYLIAGAAAVALAIGVVLLTANVGAQTRRYELAALRVAGVRPRVLRRGLLREYLHLLGLPLLVGVGVGVAGAALMLPGIPIVTAGTATGDITYEPSLGALTLAVGATVVGLVFAVLLVLRTVRRATPDQLREAP
jgi:putative ABC transport system permease protein